MAIAATAAAAPAAHHDRGRNANNQGARNSRYQCRLAVFPAISTGPIGVMAGTAARITRIAQDVMWGRERMKTSPLTTPTQRQDSALIVVAYWSIGRAETTPSTSSRGSRCR